MRVVAAGLYLKQFEEVIHASAHAPVRLVDAYFAILEDMTRKRLIGTPEELEMLLGVIRKDAFGLRVRRDTRVIRALRHVLRNSTYLAPRAASVSGAVAGHPFGVGMAR